MNDDIITATEASRAFSAILHRVSYGGETFTVKKGNRLMARIVPVVEADDDEAVMEPSATTIEHEQEMLEGLTPEEAEYFAAVVEQMRKVPENA